VSLRISDREYPLTHFTKLISEEDFTDGRPIVIVRPLEAEDSTNKLVGNLVEELHKSGHRPILVYNISYTMNGNMYTEIHQHGIYVVLVSKSCNEREECV
jgi:hypothetical protein